MQKHYSFTILFIGSLLIYLAILGAVNHQVNRNIGCKHSICDYSMNSYQWKIYVNGTYVCSSALEFTPVNQTECYTTNWSSCPEYNKCYNYNRYLIIDLVNIIIGLFGGASLIVLLMYVIQLYKYHSDEERYWLNHNDMH